jgi:prepilin signal peptidase PulO-like enzyme (type II secretory pathway)
MFYYQIAIIFIFGLIIGSFLNCLIWRLYREEKVSGRSYCPKCGNKIKWRDNIPVLSFCLLSGRCRACGKPISWQYPAVELIAGILFLTVFIKNFSVAGGNIYFQGQLPAAILLLRDWFIISAMLVIFIYDLRWYLILDKVTLPAMAIVLIFNIILGILAGNILINLFIYLISGIIGGSFFLIQFLISKGRWIGGGDIRLGFLMGLVLGWPYILEAIFLAYLAGSIVGVGLMIAGRKQWGSKIPLGAFLAPAAIAVLLWGKEILEWYFQLFQI